jgi:hypothetical protein
MINVTIENEDLSITIKDNDAYSIEDCVEVLSRALTAVFGEDIELLVDTGDDETVYIEQDQPHDHVVHEGM